MGDRTAIELSEQEMKTLAQFQKPIERLEQARRGAELALVTFINHLLETHDCAADQKLQWAVDWDGRRLVSKPAPPQAPPGVRMQKIG